MYRHPQALVSRQGGFSEIGDLKVPVEHLAEGDVLGGCLVTSWQARLRGQRISQPT